MFPFGQMEILRIATVGIYSILIGRLSFLVVQKKSEVEQVAVPFRTASPGPELVTFSNTKERNGKPIEEKIS